MSLSVRYTSIPLLWTAWNSFNNRFVAPEPADMADAEVAEEDVDAGGAVAARACILLDDSVSWWTRDRERKREEKERGGHTQMLWPWKLG